MFFTIVCSAIVNGQTKFRYNTQHITNTNSYLEDTFKPKTHRMAYRYSLGYTLGGIIGGSVITGAGLAPIGVIAFLGGLFVGPSAGSIYAKNKRAVKLGVLRRVGGSVLILTGMGLLLADGLEQSSGGSGNGVRALFGTVTVLSGFGLFIYSVMQDFSTLEESVERYNARNQKAILISPSYDATTQSFGMSLKVNF